jgi:hypothetical protein
MWFTFEVKENVLLLLTFSSVLNEIDTSLKKYRVMPFASIQGNYEDGVDHSALAVEPPLERHW